jgi:hypothetical protein
MEVNVAGPHPILLQGAINPTERHQFLVGLAKAEDGDQPPTNTPIAMMTQIRFSMLDSEEKRTTEGAVGQDIAELRWRLATLEEGKELVVCWHARQIGLYYSTSPCSEATALVRAGSITATPFVPTVPRLQIKSAVRYSPKRAISLFVSPWSPNG